MITQRFDDINALDVQNLITNAVSESTTLEFKRDLPGGTDDAKKEFLADVSALANTSGGDIVFGIDEQDGCAASITGIGTADADAELLRFNNILNSGLDPRIRYSGKPVVCEDRTLLLLRVDKSWNGPHRVVFKGSDKFFGRTATGKYPLDVQQLRRAFLDNGTVSERMRAFRAERLASIIAGATSVTMPGTSRFVLHLLPFEAFFSEYQYDVSQTLPTNDFRPLGGNGWSNRLTFEGQMAFAPAKEPNSSGSYVQVYRNGILEMVDSLLLDHTLPDTGQRYIPGIGFERFMVDGIERGVQLLTRLGVSAPIAIAVTLTNVREMVIGVDNYMFFSQLHPVLNDHLFLPEAVLPEFASSVDALIRPLADMVWNACGINRSPHFDEDGKWTKRRQ